MRVESLNFLLQYKGRVIFALNPYITRTTGFTGGDASIYSQISEYLKNLGIEVVYFRYVSLVDGLFGVKEDSGRHIWVQFLKKIEDKFLPPLYSYRLNKEINPEKDLVICDSTVSFSIKGKRCINVFHISYSGFRKKTSAPFPNSIVLGLKAFFQVRGSKNTVNVAVSEYLKNDLEEHGIRTDAVINNSVDLNVFRPLSMTKKNGYLFAAAYNYLGKGFDVIEQLKENGIVVDCYTDNQNNPRIKAMPFVSRDRIVGMYNMYRMLIFPSRYESFGLVPLEAMACGLPVIMNRVGIGLDIEKEIPEFIVSENSASEYIKHIRMVEADYEGFSNKARAFVERKYSYDIFIDMWTGLISRLLIEE